METLCLSLSLSLPRASFHSVCCAVSRGEAMRRAPLLVAVSLSVACALQDCTRETIETSQYWITTFFYRVFDISSCKTLALNDGGVRSRVDFDGLMSALKQNSGLTSLKLERGGIDESRAIALAQVLAQDSVLEELDLDGNSLIGVSGARALSKAFMAKRSALRVVDMEACGLGDAGALAFREVLATKDSSLMVLDLENNNITNAGAIQLAKVLAKNSVLEELDLHSNAGITARGAAAFLRALRRNKSLTKLSLPEPHVLQHVRQRRHHNRILRSIARLTAVNAAGRLSEAKMRWNQKSRRNRTRRRRRKRTRIGE